MEASAKAYGKLLIFGAYSILEPGNTGLVVNVSRGTTTKAYATDAGTVVFDLKNFEIKTYGRLSGGKIKLEKDNEVMIFIKSAVQFSFEYLASIGKEVMGIRIVTYNDPELSAKSMKTGFGSSATSTVSAVAAILKLHGIDDREIVYNISKYSHFRSQGAVGSGFDIAAACFGSHFFVSQPIDMSNLREFMQSKAKLSIGRFDWPPSLLPLVAFTGSSASTKVFVEKIQKFRESKPQEYNNFMQEYNNINLKLKDAFVFHKPDEIQSLLGQSWGMRKKLGEMAHAPIEPENYSRLFKEMNKRGAFAAGLTGAGGGDSILALCTSEDDKNRLADFLDRKGLTVFEGVEIINKGYEFV